MDRFLAEMSSQHVASLADEHDMDVLIPLGALEQHGPHLPLATDSFIATALAAGVAEEAGDLLVAPCLPIGCSDHHLSFSGTTSLPREVLIGYIESTVLSLLGHGLRFAYLISGHAGNMPAMEIAVQSLQDRVPGRVVAFADWPSQRDALHEVAEKEMGLSRAEVGSHAGHFETSIMMAIAPESVNRESLPSGFVGSVDEASRIMQTEGMAAVSRIGVVGDARRSSASAGLRYLEVLIGLIVEGIRNHRGSGVADPHGHPSD